MKKLLLVTTALLFACVNANADIIMPLPAVEYASQSFVAVGPRGDTTTAITGPGYFSIEFPGGMVAGQSSLGLAPMVGAGGSSTILGYGANASVDLIYYFEIVNRISDPLLVGPVDVRVTAQSASSGNAEGQAGFSVLTGFWINGINVNEEMVRTYPTAAQFDQTFTMQPYTLYRVEMLAQGSAWCNCTPEFDPGWIASFDAWVDPTFTINDPAYTILFSDGIGLAPVPGPIVGAGLPGLLGLLGFGGWSCWRRRKSQVVK